MTALLIRVLTLLLVALAGCPAPLRAGQERQDFRVLREQAARWLEQQANTTWPETLAQAQVGPVDERLRLARCPSPRFFLPAGGKLWGNGSLGVRCAEPAPWSLYVGFRNAIQGPALVAPRPLPARHVPAPGELELRQVTYAQAPDRYPREVPDHARLSRALAAGQALLVDDLDMPEIIRAGARVRVVVQGSGFNVAQEGAALNSAGLGQPVRVKMPSGRIIQGVATRDGQVAVAP
ncbi:MAG: flagellar basal body P-ring formation chaperone FlgA [Pseudomonadota bacterium]